MEYLLSMKPKFIPSLVFISFLFGCTSPNTHNGIKEVNADDLVENIDAYIDSRLVTEGTIVHICSVDGKKMKLRTDNGAIIKIVPFDLAEKFDSLLYKKRVIIHGVVKESRISDAMIAEKEQAKVLLCHIDNSSCKDSAWVNRQVQNGRSDSLSMVSTDQLKETMERAGKDYVSVVFIVAERVDIIK